MTATRSGTPKNASKRPDDAPFDFNLDTAEPPRELTPFVFHWNKRRWTMHHLDELDIWELVKAADGGEITAMTGAFRLALGRDWEPFRKHDLPQWQFKRLFKAYREHCGINVDGTPVDGNDEI